MKFEFIPNDGSAPIAGDVTQFTFSPVKKGKFYAPLAILATEPVSAEFEIKAQEFGVAAIWLWRFYMKAPSSNGELDVPQAARDKYITHLFKKRSALLSPKIFTFHEVAHKVASKMLPNQVRIFKRKPNVKNLH